LLLALIVLGAMAVVAVPSLLLFFMGAETYHSYSTGTPTTATITDCSHGKGAHCEAAWSIEGKPCPIYPCANATYGEISGGFFDDTSRVGATLDVRVHGRTAYTANAWTSPVAIGGCVLIGGLTVVFVVAFVVIRPRLTRR
jgi:hypothetical protein